MTPARPEPEQLVVRQDIFAGDRFWVALNRLADRAGHDGHARYLAGGTEATNRYRLWCTRCEAVIATMIVERDDHDS